MQPNGLRRRRLLQAGGAALAMAAAGCVSDVPVIGDDDEDEPPEYADWVATETDDGEGASVAYVNLAAMWELDDGDDGDDEADGDDLDDFEDPMLGLPVFASFIVVLGAEWALMEADLGDLIDEDAADAYESSIDDLIMANEAIVLSGTVDAEEIDAALTAEPENDFVGSQFERTDEVAGYAIYEPVADDGGDESDEDDDDFDFDFGTESERTWAVGDDAIVVADERELVVRAVETGAGEEPRAVDEYDEFRRLLSVAGGGAMVWGGYSPDGLEDEEPDETDDEMDDPDGDDEDGWFEDVDAPNGAVASLAVGEGEVTGRMAIAFDELGDEDREELEAELGAQADDVSVSYSDGFVSATATYAREDVGDVGDVEDA